MKISKKYWYLVTMLLGVIVVVLVYGVFRGKGSDVKSGSVLFLKAVGALAEVNIIEPSPFSGRMEQMTFQRLVRLLSAAKEDDRIALVVLEVSIETLPAKAFELHDAIMDYRKSGKMIFGYVRDATDMDYMVASACDVVVSEPHSFLEVNGLNVRLQYFSEALEAIGVGVDVVRVGRYKSAVEMFTRTGPSEEDLEQRGELLDGFFDKYVENVVRNREIEKEAFLEVINKVGILGDDDAKVRGLVDTSLYLSDLKEMVRYELGYGEDEWKDHVVRGEDYEDKYSVRSSYRVAVINVMGEIGDGQSGDGMAGDVTITKALDAAAKDVEVKAIVLRVDSPGGGVVPSDKIRQAVLRAKRSKPVVVSMSDLAASGGYWVSADGTRVIAHPMTITGSIGIFSLKPNMNELHKKLRFRSAVLKRGEMSDDFSVLRGYSAGAYKAMSEVMKSEYRKFEMIVANGRNKSVEEVGEVAGGRVWLGTRALEKGLVDELGGFMKAVEVAVEVGGIKGEDVQIVNYPESRSYVRSLLERDDEGVYSGFVRGIAEDAAGTFFSMYGMGLFSEEYEMIKQVIMMMRGGTGMDARVRLPYMVSVM